MEPRYEVVGEIGRGGMGRITLVHDRWLGRMAARKVLRADRPELAARLWREARLGARLDHPGIVPIYDAGVDEEGNPWFVMRLFRGRTLRERVSTSEEGERWALLRAVLQVAEAVAFAHRVGIVHRDLSPDNVLVGEPGEVQVVDWGLAKDLQAAEEDELPAWEASGAGTRTGAVMGTVPWLSPEQARGEAADRRSDVWMLGALVRWVVTGTPPVAGEGDAAAARIGAGRVDLLPAELPSDLAAVIARCMAGTPADRYPDAAAMAEDLGRWLDGRAVSVYGYGPVARGMQWLRARRVRPEWVLAGLVGMAALAAWGWRDTLVARDRALTAEADATRALETADAHLSARLAAQASRALKLGAVPEAEVLARGALARASSDLAVGVLAASASGRGLVLQSWSSIPDLRAVTPLSQGGALWLGSTFVRRVDEDGATRWQRPLALQQAIEIGGSAVVVDDNEGVGWLDLSRGDVAWTIPRDPFVAGLIGGDDGRFHGWDGMAVWEVGSDRIVPRCGETSLTAAVAVGTDRWFACGDGRLLQTDGDLRSRRELGPLRDRTGQPREVRSLWPLAGGDVVVGTLRDEILRLDPETGAVRWRLHLSVGAVRGLQAHGEVLFASVERGGPLLVDVATGDLWGRLPASVGGSFRVSEAPEGLAIDAWGKRHTRWRWTRPATPLWIAMPRGVSTLAVAPSGRELGVGMADGHLARVSLLGEPTQMIRRGRGVFKGLAWADQGLLAAQAWHAGGVWWDRGGEVVDLRNPPARRAGVARGLGPWLLLYGQGLWRWGEGEALAPLVEGDAFVEALDAPGGPLLIDAQGRATRWQVGGASAFSVPVGSVVAAGASEVIAVAAERELWLQDLATGRLGPPVLSEDVSALALSSRGDLLGVGKAGGEVWVYRVDDLELTPWLRLPAHTERVSALVFSPDGRSLYSGSWDARLRRWSMDVGEIEPDADVWGGLDVWEASAWVDGLP